MSPRCDSDVGGSRRLDCATIRIAVSGAELWEGRALPSVSALVLLDLCGGSSLTLTSEVRDITRGAAARHADARTKLRRKRQKMSGLERDRGRASQRHRLALYLLVGMHVIVSLVVGFADYFNYLSVARCGGSIECDHVLLYWTLTGIWLLAGLTLVTVLAGSFSLCNRGRPYLWVPMVGTFVMLIAFAVASSLDATALQLEK